jgi:hypothetical protein
MPKLYVIIIAVVLLSGFSRPAYADSFSDIKQVKGVLLYEDFQHWLNLAYNYDGNESKQNKSANNVFQESYNATLQAALFDPRILDTTLQGSLVFNQNQSKNNTSSSSGSNQFYQYNFVGSGLDRSKIPFTLLSFRAINTVQNTFSPATTNDNSGNEFGISFLNDRLKSRFQFARNSLDTSESGKSNSLLSNSYSYLAQHQYSGLSETSFSASFSDHSGRTSSGQTLTSSANALSVANSLHLGAIKNYTLLSSFQLNNAVTDNISQRSLSFSENFAAALGRALSLNSSYSLSNTRNTASNGLSQENTQNRGDIRVRHNLFKSLTTELGSTVDFNKKRDGNENIYTIQGNATYQKNFTAGNRLSLSINDAYNLVDRRLGSGTTSIIDEPRHVVQGQVIELSLSDGKLQKVDSIKSKDGLTSYTEGIDYTVNYALGRITIRSGGGVGIDSDGKGSDLNFSYTVYKDPLLTYISENFSVNSDLTLLDGDVTLGASWSESRQSLVSGPTTNSLQGSRSMMLYVTGNYDIFTSRFSYRNDAMGRQTVQSFDGNGSTSWQASNSSISLSIHNSYTINSDALTSVEYRENSSDFSMLYSRSLKSNGKFTLQGALFDQRSEIRSAKDSISIRANYMISLNRFTVNMSGQTIWIFETNSTTRNDSVHIDVSRYF